MLLGKRPRSTLPIKRTTSMKDVSAVDGSPPSDQVISVSVDGNQQQKRRRVVEDFTLERRWNGTDSMASASTSAEIVSPLRPRRGVGEFLAVAMKISPFLRDCTLCNSHLLPTRDIFMYRGEAFCSLKCRQQLINHDMRKEKLKLFLFSMKKKVSAQANSQASKASDNGEETLAAAGEEDECCLSMVTGDKLLSYGPPTHVPPPSDGTRQKQRN